jgi:Na+/proline symporter
MSNKPHHRPHQSQRRASRTTRLLVVILIVAAFAFILALELTGHIIITGRR